VFTFPPVFVWVQLFLILHKCTAGSAFQLAVIDCAGNPVSCRGHAPHPPRPPAPHLSLSHGATAVDGNLLKKFRFLVFFFRHFRLAFVPRWRRSLFISCPALSSSYSENSQCRTMPGVCVRGST